MPRGERSTTWFAELVTALRHSWRPELTGDGLIGLRDELQRRLDEILRIRRIVPARLRCFHCGHVGPGAPPRLSVRAVILALRRFAVESEDTVRRLDKGWAKYRALHQLDGYGRGAEPAAEASGVSGGHMHVEETR